jgi:hypothetical protein
MISTILHLTLKSIYRRCLRSWQNYRHHIAYVYTLFSFHISLNIREPFAKSGKSTHYSELEHCVGAVTVSFSKYLPWQAMHFLQRSTHFSKTCCRPLITSKFLASEFLFMVGKAQKSHGTRTGLYGGCFNGIPPIHFFQAKHRIQFRSRPMRFLGFSNHEKGAPRQEISKRSTVCSTFSRSGWSVAEMHRLPREVLRKRDRHRTFTMFRLGVTRWIH